MGGAVSSGQDNNELVDNLMNGNYIRSPRVERVFRAVDRGDYMTQGSRHQAYKDLAWRHGPMHLSSPCIYCEVLEGLEMRPGLSFLNIGSGMGYLSTMVGLLLGSSGISHGVEIHPTVVEYAIEKNTQFMGQSPVLDEFDYCEPKYFLGNGLCLAPLQAPYDRVYCGAGCPVEYTDYLKQLIRIGGILVMPLKDMLLQVKRLGESEWSTRSLLNVTFAPLRMPASDSTEVVKLDEQAPPPLQQLARREIRRAIRDRLLARHPELRAPQRLQRPKPTRAQRHMNHAPRRICIPIEERPAQFNMLHDLDREDGANEMNALLSLVLSMGENRVAGALRFDGGSESSVDEDEPLLEENAEVELDPENDDPDPGPDPDDPLQRRINVVFRSLLNERNDPDNDVSRSLTFAIRDSDLTDARLPDGDPENGPPASSMADVEVYIDNPDQVPGTSRFHMQWETPTSSKRETSEETELGRKGSDEKRQKLDSGIGENSPSSSSDSKDKCADTEFADNEHLDDSHLSDSHTDTEVQVDAGPRRHQKRTRRLSPCSSTDEDATENEPEEQRRRRKRRVVSRQAQPYNARFSVLMKRCVRSLPLPCVLQKYVNLGRSF
ncbi:uncharacterized protein [Battus philenor]|uniref:uncharacterized protein n=1 Tax=Battus philenor TaxID=42288 RepID=UPI0035D0A71A